MLAECCAIAFRDSTFPVYYYFNESTLSFTNMASSSDGKYDDFDEEGWNLLPNNLVLTVDAYTTNTVLTGTNSETYNSSTNTWSTASNTIQQLWDSNCMRGGGSFEVGPAVLRPDGTVIATGGSDCEPGTSGGITQSTAVTLSVSSFTVVPSPATQNIKRGASTTYTATVKPQNGFHGVVTFSVSGLPANTTGTFNPTSVTGSGNSVLTVSTTKKTPAGTFTLTITGTSGGASRSTTVSLTVRSGGK